MAAWPALLAPASASQTVFGPVVTDRRLVAAVSEIGADLDGKLAAARQDLFLVAETFDLVPDITFELVSRGRTRHRARVVHRDRAIPLVEGATDFDYLS
jgi:hypothetical protein